MGAMNPPGNNDRWERGLPHHPVAEAVFALIARADWEHGGDYFHRRQGGDGDNGETLMFALSAMIEADPGALQVLRDAVGGAS